MCILSLDLMEILTLESLKIEAGGTSLSGLYKIVMPCLLISLRISNFQTIYSSKSSSHSIRQPFRIAGWVVRMTLIALRCLHLEGDNCDAVSYLTSGGCFAIAQPVPARILVFDRM